MAGWIVFGATLGPAAGHGQGHGNGHGEAYVSAGLVLTVNETARMPNAHDDMAGAGTASSSGENLPVPRFPMPRQMMPGMEAEDEERLHVEVSLRNASATAKPYRANDFQLSSRSGGHWPVKEDSFGGATLGPRFVVNLDLYFDIPHGQDGLAVRWAPAGGESVTIPLTVSAASAEPTHRHG